MVNEKRTEQMNAWLLTATVFIISLQILLILSVVVSYMPSVYTFEVADIFPRGRKAFPRKYDLFLYRSWIVMAIALTFALFLIFKKHLRSQELRGRLSGFVITSSFWLLLGYWAAFELIVYSFPWARVLLAGAIIGNLITWGIWAVRPDWILSLGRAGAGRIAQLKDNQWFKNVIVIGASKGLILRIGLVVTMGLLILNHQRLFAGISLPYFLPLRFAAVGIFTMSFAVPIIYMAVVLGALERMSLFRLCPRAQWYLILGSCGLISFLIYVRWPIPSSLYMALWPGGLLFLLSLMDLLSSDFRRSGTNIKEIMTPKAGTSLLGGIQTALVCVWIQEHIKSEVLPADFSTIIYGAFMLGTGIVYWILSMLGATKKFSGLIKNLFPFVVFQGLLVTLSALAWFKLVVYDYRADLARWWFMVLGVTILIQPIVWPLLCVLTRKVKGIWYRLDEKLRAVLVWGIVLIFVAGAVYVPNVEAMCAHIFMGEYMHHTDTFAMGPAWAAANGAVIDVDVYSRYGIGSVYFFIWLMKLLGGISYLHLFTGIVWICTLYFILVYIFYRRWLNNPLLALACWMMAFKAQIAFELAYPFVFTYPQSTVVRQWPDIIWMILMLCYMESGNWWCLGLASITTGFALWYMPSIGCYMIIAHAFMVGMAAWRCPTWRERIIAVFGPLALAVMTSVLLFVAILGRWFFSPVFWHNALDFMKFFLLTAIVTLTDSLVHRQFLNPVVFCIIVFVYVATIVKVGSDFLKNAPTESRKDWLAVGLSIYGLGLLEHYVTFSVDNNYYSKTIPFFIVVFYWILKGIKVFSAEVQKRFSMALAGLAFIALVTNHSYMSYPNAFNISSNPLLDKRVARPLPDGRPYFFHKHRWTVSAAMQLSLNNLGNTDEGLLTEYDFKSTDDLIARYHQLSDFSQDAFLISSLTSPKEQVALIASYEVRLLMQANRRPLFFFFPLLETRPMRVRSLPNDMLDTKQDVQRMIDDVTKAKPSYVFMEKVMSKDELPSAYNESNPGLMALLRFVKSNYLPYKEGKYLVAFKRKH